MSKKMLSYPSYWFLMLLSIVALLLIAGYVVSMVFLIGDWEDRASFGEMFGAIDALFSGLALAGVLYTIHVQRKELHNAGIAMNEQIEMQMLTAEINALRHEIDVALYEIELQVKLGTPPETIDMEYFEYLKTQLVFQHKKLELKEKEVQNKLELKQPDI